MTSRSRVAVRVGDRSVDVALPPGLPVYEVLRAAAVDLDDPALAVVDSTGQPVDLYRATSDELADGTVLHVLRAAGAAAAGVGAAAPDPAAARPASAWPLAVAGAAAVVVAAGAALDLGGRGVLGTADRGALAGALALAAVLLALVPAGAVAARARGGVATVVCALLGGAAGAVAVDPGLPGAGRLAVVTGLMASTVAVAARWAAARRRRDDAADAAGMLLVVLAVAAFAAAGALLAGLPGALAAALLLGAVPSALRALPVLCVDVPDEQLLDVDQVARTVSAVRAPVTRPLGAVNARLVQRTVRSAERRRDAGTVAISLTAPLVAPALLLDDGARGGGVQAWTGVAACLLVAVSLALQPRTSRGRLMRWMPRACSAVLLLELGALAAATDRGALLAAGLVGLSLLVAAASIAVGRGWRSVGLSRLADGIEGAATVLALPVALVAAGAVEVVRQLAAA